MDKSTKYCKEFMKLINSDSPYLLKFLKIPHQNTKKLGLRVRNRGNDQLPVLCNKGVKEKRANKFNFKNI